MRTLLDTAVFIYAVGGEHPNREPARGLVRLLAEERLTADISVQLLQEYAHVRGRRGVARSRAVDEARAISALCRVHDLTMSHLQTALQLYRTHAGLDMADAVHAATALACQAEVIVSPDGGFDEVPGLRRLDIAEAYLLLSA